jgi:hypothetical protein
MAIDQSDVYVFLKPTEEWPRARTKDDLISAMKAKLEEHAPGAGYSFSQPIQMGMQELMESGVRSDIAVKLYGDDLNILGQKAEQIAAAVETIPGAADVRAQTIRFRTEAEMLESFGMHTGGKEYRRLVGVTIFFGTDSFRDQQTAGFHDAETGQWTAVPPISGKPMNYFWRMNEAGLGVGDACEGIWNMPSNCVGWTWSEKTPVYQFPSYSGASSTMPLGINNRGQIVGIAVLSDSYCGFLEYKGNFTLLTGGRPSIARDVNDAGEVLLTLLDTGEMIRKQK